MTPRLSRWGRGAATFATLLLLTGCGRFSPSTLPLPTWPPGKQSLDLKDTDVTDAGLKELAALKGLQALSLGWTKVTDAGLKELAGLKALQSLNLGGTQVRAWV